jgi:hypothetical protein
MARKRRKPAFLKQTFQARPLPEAIFIGDDCVTGPFCFHCGNPLSLHGPNSRCPNRHLNPLFPSPNLPYARDDND